MSPYEFTKELESMHQRMRKWLEHLSPHRVSSCFSGQCSWIPSADICETEKAYHVFVELAGVDPSSIELLVKGGTLHLSGMRDRPQVPECTGIHQLEIDSGTFRRTFHFPANLNGDGAESFYRHGFLEIILPKLPPQAAFHVPLKHE